jgi:hypothetical protein
MRFVLCQIKQTSTVHVCTGKVTIAFTTTGVFIDFVSTVRPLILTVRHLIVPFKDLPRSSLT